MKSLSDLMTEVHDEHWDWLSEEEEISDDDMSYWFKTYDEDVFLPTALKSNYKAWIKIKNSCWFVRKQVRETAHLPDRIEELVPQYRYQSPIRRIEWEMPETREDLRRCMEHADERFGYYGYDLGNM